MPDLGPGHASVGHTAPGRDRQPQVCCMATVCDGWVGFGLLSPVSPKPGCGKLVRTHGRPWGRVLEVDILHGRDTVSALTHVWATEMGLEAARPDTAGLLCPVAPGGGHAEAGP